jgi:hypothetical protein
MRRKQFQLLPLECSTDVRWRLVYHDILDSRLMPQLIQDKPNVVFQHDRASPHTRNEMTFLKRQLPQRWVGRGGSTSWPPRSPNLTPLDFFLRGFVKDEVYIQPMPIALNNLKARMRTATAKTDRPLLQNVWHEVECRFDVCTATNGAHTEFVYSMKKWVDLYSGERLFCVDITFLPINFM